MLGRVLCRVMGVLPMGNDVEISIHWAATNAVVLAARTLILPVELGRLGADHQGHLRQGDGQIIPLGAGFDTLSRRHMTVTEGADGGVVVTDLSANGVSEIARVGAKPVLIGPGGTVALARGAVRGFETVGLRLTICALRNVRATPIGQPLHLVYDSATSGRLKALDLDGVSIALVVEGQAVLLRRHPGEARAALLALRAEGAPPLGVIGPDGSGGIEAIGGLGGEVAHNRRPLAQDEAVAMDHLDTLEVRGQVLRILSAEEGKGLACAHAACRQMNPYLPGENCRYCGQRLGDGLSYWVHG